MNELDKKATQNLSGLNCSIDEKELSNLMRLSQSGDRDSYTILLKRLNSMLSKFVTNSFQRLSLKGTGGEQDVVQEILIALHTKRANYDPSQFFLPWIYAIARYKIIDHFRKNKNHLRKNVPIDEELENLELITIYDFDTQLDLGNIFKSLPEKQFLILQMMKIEGLSIQEIKDKTGFSTSDIKVSIHRALKTLQDNVREKNNE